MIPHRIAEGSGLALLNQQTGKAVGPAEIKAVQDVSIPQRELFIKHFKNGVYIPDNTPVQAVLNVKHEGVFGTAVPTGQAGVSSPGEDAVRAPEITVTEPIAVQWQAPAEFTFDVETGTSQVIRVPLPTESPASPEAPVVLLQTSEPGLPPPMPDDAIRQAATLPGTIPEAAPETVPAGASSTESTELEQPFAKAETPPQASQIMANVAQLDLPPETQPDAAEPALPRTNPGGDGPAQWVADPGPRVVDLPPERADLQMAPNPPVEPLPVQPDNRLAERTALRADPAKGVSANKIEDPVQTDTNAPIPPAAAMPGDVTETTLPVPTGAVTDAPELADQRPVEQQMRPVDRPLTPATPTAPRTEPAAIPPARMASDAGPAMPSDPPPPAIDGEPAPQAAPMPRPESTAPTGAAPLAMAATNMGKGEPPIAAVATAFVQPDKPKPAPAPPAAPAPAISTPTPTTSDAAGIIGNDAAIMPETSLETLPRSAGHIPASIAPNAGLSPGAAMPSPRYIAAQIAVQNTQPGTPLEIALDPPELGKVRLTLLPGDAGMTVQITAERAETIDLLRRHAGILSDEFQRQGQRDASFDFSRDHSDHRPQTSAANAEWLIESDETGPASPQTGAIHPTGPAQNLRLSGLDVRF